MNNLREILRYFNQNLLQNSTWKTPTRTAMELWDTSQAPRMPGRQPELQPGERSQGRHPNQASSGGRSKGNGQGSHALPGLTQ